MMIVGIIVLVGALVAVGVGIYQWRKLKMIGGAPLAKTGQLVGNASEKGLISVEGKIEMAGEGLIAPCSGRPCVYYEITVQQRWSEHVRTENGTKTKKGKSNVKTDKVGAQFFVNDGSGQAKVDATEAKVQAKLEKSFTGEGPASGYLTFGNYSVNVPPRSGKGWATGTVVTEKIVTAEGDVYVAGRLEGDVIMRKKSMGGRLIIAKEGVEALQKSTKRKAIASAAAAAMMVPGGGAMAAMGDMPEGTSQCTSGIAGAIDDACRGRQSSSSPVEFTWTVAEAGTYSLTAVGTGTDVNYRLWPSVQVRDAAGASIFQMSAGGGQAASAQGVFAPGTYTVSVTDTASNWSAGLEGGAGFSFDVDLVSLQEPTPGVATGEAVAPATEDETNVPAEAQAEPVAEPTDEVIKKK